ncbi:MAG TPA: dolichyl-phosphate beta-glucosyltransferase [Acidobacteriota bacterium]
MKPELSVVIPAFNEETRLPTTLGRVKSYLDGQAIPFEVIVVDDGSQDKTLALAQQIHSGFRQLRILANVRNRGKGFSVRRGFLEARAALVLVTDADLSAPIEEYEKLRSALEGNDGAIGSRALKQSDVYRRQSVFREWSGKIFNQVMRLLTGLKFQDTQCGFKLFRREPFTPVFAAQRTEGFAFDVEILYLAHKLGLRIVEVPVRWGNVEGTRVGLIAGLKAFGEIAKICWIHRGKKRGPLN